MLCRLDVKTDKIQFNSLFSRTTNNLQKGRFWIVMKQEIRSGSGISLYLIAQSVLICLAYCSVRVKS